MRVSTIIVAGLFFVGPVTLCPLAAHADGLSDANAGMAALESGDYAKAVTLFTRAITKGKLSNDDLELAYVKRAAAYQADGHEQAAIDDLGRALKLNPADDEALTLSRKSSKAIPLGQFGKWRAYVHGSVASCAAVSMAAGDTSTGIMISDWPERDTKAELQVIVAMDVQPDSLNLSIGDQSFVLFAKGAGQKWSAWLKNLSDEDTFLRAIESQSIAKVEGTNRNGQHFSKVFSLSGVGAALSEIHTVCKM